MNKHTAEEIVRRATAAFNSGKREEARKLCEQGLSRHPGEPMLHHLLAAVLFSQGEVQAARTHVEASLARRPGNAAAHLLAARIARAARDFDGALSHLDRTIALAPQREAFWRRRGRSTRQVLTSRACGHRRARHGRRSCRSFHNMPKRWRGSDGWHGRMAIMPPP